jgi:hypothetical protein
MAIRVSKFRARPWVYKRVFFMNISGFRTLDTRIFKEIIRNDEGEAVESQGAATGPGPRAYTSLAR